MIVYWYSPRGIILQAQTVGGAQGWKFLMEKKSKVIQPVVNVYYVSNQKA